MRATSASASPADACSFAQHACCASHAAASARISWRRCSSSVASRFRCPASRDVAAATSAGAASPRSMATTSTLSRSAATTSRDESSVRRSSACSSGTVDPPPPPPPPPPSPSRSSWRSRAIGDAPSRWRTRRAARPRAGTRYRAGQSTCGVWRRTSPCWRPCGGTGHSSRSSPPACPPSRTARSARRTRCATATTACRARTACFRTPRSCARRRRARWWMRCWLASRRPRPRPARPPTASSSCTTRSMSR
mmetsp:Transcript_24377/g.73872  ORF Transcript_24377/g.73872 Transcript_24377/m.73872 type:complete len:251 (-) Transcript_24377:173-925(-)